MAFYRDHSDIELVEMLKVGNTSAFEEIYRRYATVLFRYALHNLSSREECKELLQDVFESLWTKREVQEIGMLRPYLYNAVRYKIIRLFRRSRLIAEYARHYCIFEEGLRTIPNEPDNSETVSSLILKHLDGLPQRAQEAFKLRVIENLSNSEIADRMHITKTTVELYMVKAHSHLRAIGLSKFREEAN